MYSLIYYNWCIIMSNIKDICLFKETGCNYAYVCDGRSTYIENKNKKHCNRYVEHEIELWRTDYMREIQQ